MAFEESNGSGMYMPVAPAGYGNNSMFGGDGAWWFILLFLAMGSGLWGNNFGGGMGNMMGFYPAMNQSDVITSGFQNQMLQSGITGLQSSVSSGFNDLTSAFYNSQISNLQSMNSLQAQMAQCCCENRLATANLQSVIQTEGCADRSALSDALNVIRTDLNSGIQSIKDQMCQDTITRLTNENNQLRDNATRANIENYVQNALTAQTQYFLSLYPPPSRTATDAATT